MDGEIEKAARQDGAARPLVRSDQVHPPTGSALISLTDNP
jgi:hypothetical protein